MTFLSWLRYPFMLFFLAVAAGLLVAAVMTRDV